MNEDVARKYYKDYMTYLECKSVNSDKKKCSFINPSNESILASQLSNIPFYCYDYKQDNKTYIPQDIKDARSKRCNHIHCSINITDVDVKNGASLEISNQCGDSYDILKNRHDMTSDILSFENEIIHETTKLEILDINYLFLSLIGISLISFCS